MDYHIRSYADQDLEDIIQVSLLAWEPVFISFRQILGANIYSHMFPNWRNSQRDAIETYCRDRGKSIVLVAESGGKVIGFLAYELRLRDETGEVMFLAVHPDYQNLGVGTELNLVALQQMAEAGMKLAEVHTGGDESHAPARRSYEKAGYTAFPVVHYYKDLSSR